MKTSKTDRRVQYTKMILKNSLLELMKEKHINKITVKEICQKADINRGTFYAHYLDSFDLLFQIQGELFEEINSMLQSLDLDRSDDLVEALIKCIHENSDLCRILLGENGDREFLKKIVFIAQEKSIFEWKRVVKNENPQTLEYLYTFTASGAIGILQEWIQKDMKESPEEIARLIMKITNSGINSFLKN